MEEKQICCCGSSGWTRVIGWFQLVCSMIWITFPVMLLIALAAAAGQYEKASGITPQEGLAVTVAAVVIGFYLLIVLVSLVMSIFLLKGSYKRNPKYLQAWITYTAIFLVLWLLIRIKECFDSPGGTAVTIVTILGVLLVQGFCIWVVNTHKNEILNNVQARPLHSVKA